MLVDNGRCRAWPRAVDRCWPSLRPGADGYPDAGDGRPHGPREIRQRKAHLQACHHRHDRPPWRATARQPAGRHAGSPDQAIHPDALYAALRRWIAFPASKPWARATAGPSRRRRTRPAAQIPPWRAWTQRGLAPWGQALYLRVLAQFVQDFGASAQAITTGRRPLGLALARRLAHSLKSGSAVRRPAWRNRSGSWRRHNGCRRGGDAAAWAWARTSARICSLLAPLVAQAQPNRPNHCANAPTPLQPLLAELRNLLENDDAAPAPAAATAEKAAATPLARTLPALRRAGGGHRIPRRTGAAALAVRRAGKTHMNPQNVAISPCSSSVSDKRNRLLLTGAVRGRVQDHPGQNGLQALGSRPYAPDLSPAGRADAEMDGMAVIPRAQSATTPRHIPVVAPRSTPPPTLGRIWAPWNWAFHPPIARVRVQPPADRAPAAPSGSRSRRARQPDRHPNRRHRFDRSLAQEWSRCQRSGLPLSLIVVVDQFKTVQRHPGPRRGRPCAAGRGRRAALQAARAARRGGARWRQEFVLLLPGSDANQFSLADELLQRMAGAPAAAPGNQRRAL